MNNAAAFALLNTTGWSTVLGIPDNEALVDLARSLNHGSSRQLPIKVLEPTPTATASPGTLSAKFGVEAFPLHTDTAFWPVPARYLVMRVTGDLRRRSILLDFERVYEAAPSGLREAFIRSVWRVPSFAGGIYCSLRFAHGPSRGWRWDENVMIPANAAARNVSAQMGSLLASIPTVPYKWSPGAAVVIDNWRMLHGREPAPPVEQERKLHRIYAGVR